MSRGPDSEFVSKAFVEALNRQGYTLQQVVLQSFDQFFQKRRSDWIFEAAELPVSVQGFDTRIDFLLKKREGGCYLVGECKRANPALSNWCFVKLRYTRRGFVDQEDKVLVDYLEFDLGGTFRSVRCQELARSKRAQHLGLEVRCPEKPGDKDPKSNKGAIDDAATQVLKGLNGLVHHFAANPNLRETYVGVYLVPVIITTARLWVCETDLSQGSLLNGELGDPHSAMEEIDWLLYQYPVSLGIKHALPDGHPICAFTDLLERRYLRTIAIVSCQGIETFLNWCSSLDFAFPCTS